MLRDPELAAVIEQALRNVATLELLVKSGGGNPGDAEVIERLRSRLAALKADYTRETDELTRLILQRAIERRRGPDRRRIPDEIQQPVLV